MSLTGTVAEWSRCNTSFTLLSPLSLSLSYSLVLFLEPTEIPSCSSALIALSHHLFYTDINGPLKIIHPHRMDRSICFYLSLFLSLSLSVPHLYAGLFFTHGAIFLLHLFITTCIMRGRYWYHRIL